MVAKKASGSVVQLRKIKRKKNGDPPPLIENICRTIIPLGGKVVIYGENFVDGSSEVYIQLNDCHCTEPLDPDYFGDCGCWSMYPGQSIGWADRVIADGTILIFSMPDDFLTHDDKRDPGMEWRWTSGNGCASPRSCKDSCSVDERPVGQRELGRSYMHRMARLLS